MLIRLLRERLFRPYGRLLMGVLVLGERLRRAQWAALGLGGLAVMVLGVTRLATRAADDPGTEPEDGPGRSGLRTSGAAR